MPFATGDRSMIVKILELNRIFDRPDSIVESLMDVLEQDDNQHGTTYVAEVQALILEYSTIKSNPNESNVNPHGLKEVELDRDYRVEFFNANSGNENVSLRLGEIKTEIQNTLDPYCELLDDGNGSGTVVHCM